MVFADLKEITKLCHSCRRPFKLLYHPDHHKVAVAMELECHKCCLKKIKLLKVPEAAKCNVCGGKIKGPRP